MVWISKDDVQTWCTKEYFGFVISYKGSLSDEELATKAVLPTNYVPFNFFTTSLTARFLQKDVQISYFTAGERTFISGW
jgi:hypothetical protein